MTFSAFNGSLHSLLDFLFSLKQCVPTAAVILSALAYKLVQELAVSHLCTVQVAYMVYLARLWSAVHCWLACIDCSMMEGSILLFNALRTFPEPCKVEADCRLLHLYHVLWCDSYHIYIYMFSYLPQRHLQSTLLWAKVPDQLQMELESLEYKIIDSESFNQFL